MKQFFGFLKITWGGAMGEEKNVVKLEISLKSWLGFLASQLIVSAVMTLVVVFVIVPWYFYHL